MKKVIAVLLSMTTAIAMLLFAIAAMLIWAPELLFDILRIGVVVACIIAGICMLIPLLLTVFGIASSAAHEKQCQHIDGKKTTAGN